ncbi:unnamed protein product [Orchesella dallaii]|uniref:Gustatory receptor n=1 Tax=Orchesella dallaii TaxID=48710 RepID=A0ABP1RS07_9HEXA
MALPGFTANLIFGWCFSVIILEKPWGIPKFKWLSFPIFFAFLYMPLFIFFNVDLIYHATDTLTGPSKERIDRLVRQLSYIILLTSNSLIRIIFMWKGRKLADFLRRLKFYSKSRAKANKNPLSLMDVVVTYLVFFSTAVVAINGGVVTYRNPVFESWLQELSRLTHAIAFSCLFQLPVMIPVQCAFALILASMAYLGVIFGDYCQYVVYTLTQNKTKVGISIISTSSSSEQGDQPQKPDVENISATPSPPPPSQDHLFFTNQLRREILAKFEIVREIFDLAHEIVSPMALVLLADSSIQVVMKGYETMFVGKAGMISNVGNMVNYVSYVWILQSAQRLQNTISAGKAELEETLVNLSDETNKLEKHALRDVLKAMSVWNWEFTACELFVIDRRLASGILSLILTYVIVLVQLKVSDDTPDFIALANATQAHRST